MQKLLFFVALVYISIGNLSANALSEAQNLFESGKREQAMSKVNSYLKSQPKSAEARFLKGLILVEQGETAAAIDVFTTLTRDYPELPEPYNNIAVIHAAEGDYDSARVALQAALKTHPSYSTAYENLGDIYAKLASEAYQQALDLEKRDPGKLKVKLSLISNLFLAETKSMTVAEAKPAAKPSLSRSKVPVQPEGTVKRAAIAADMPVSKPVSVKQKVDQSVLVRSTINSWAASWSAQDVSAYLSHYADSFKPAKGSAKHWRAQRHARLKKPKYIRVVLENIKLVKIAEKSASVELTQTYESNTYRDKSRKRFDLILANGQWKINREVSI